jgi:peptide/nickel transport system substrate-binding protein
LYKPQVSHAQPTQATTPRKGGTIRLGMAGGSSSDQLNPVTYTDSVTIAMGHGLFNGLIECGPDNTPIPELANSIEPKPGAKDWILTLRRDVSFSNGKTFTPEDAIYSLNLHRGDTRSGAASVMKNVVDIRKLSGDQIQISLKQADAEFPAILTDYHLLMVPEGHTDWSKPIGTGPMVLERFDPGVRAVMKRTRDYWKAGRGHLDAADITVIGDSSARLSALISGQVDVINRVDPKTVNLLGRSANHVVLRSPAGWHPIIAMTCDRAPFDNADFRAAMKLGIDRPQVLKTLFSGLGTIANDQPIPPSSPFFHTELPQAPYDPDRAKSLLMKSGLGDPRVVMQASDGAFGGAVDLATLFQASAAKANLKIEVRREPADGFWSNVWLKGACVVSYWGGRPSATQMLSVAYERDAPWNLTHYIDPRFDSALLAARSELDPVKRRPHLWDAQELVAHNAGAVIPVFRDYLDAHHRKVGGMTPHSLYDLCNGRIVEKAWFNA